MQVANVDVVYYGVGIVEMKAVVKMIGIGGKNCGESDDCRQPEKSRSRLGIWPQRFVRAIFGRRGGTRRLIAARTCFGGAHWTLQSLRPSGDFGPVRSNIQRRRS